MYMMKFHCLVSKKDKVVNIHMNVKALRRR